MGGHWKVRDPYEFLLPVDVTVCGRHVMWCCVVGVFFRNAVRELDTR